MEEIVSSVQEELVTVALADECLDTENGNARNFKITLISAENLPEVRNVFGSRVQAKVTVRGHENTKWETEVDYKNGLNPVWNYSANYNILETGITNEDLWIVIKLYSKRTFGDRIIGEVNISVKALFDTRTSATLTFPVKQGNIDTGGILNVSYRFSVKKRDALKKYIKAGCIILVKAATMAAMIGFD